MIHRLKHLCFLTVAVLLTMQTSASQAQLLRGRWYYDPIYPEISDVSATRAFTYAAPVPQSEILHDPESGSGSEAGRDEIASAEEFLPTPIPDQKLNGSHRESQNNRTGDARLKFWVPDGMQVEINGRLTRLQNLGGKHKGSREFSLSELSYDESSLCQIAVWDADVMVHEETFMVRAGGDYVRRYAPPLGYLKHRAERLELKERARKAMLRAQREAQRAKEQAELLWQEAAQAKAEAAKSLAAATETLDKAKQHEANAKAGADRAEEAGIRAEQSAIRAEQSAIQAARTNTESFKLVKNELELFAYLQFAEDGSVKEFLFEKPTTYEELKFEESSGALSDLENVQIAIVYQCTITSANPAPKSPIKVMGTATFNKGKAVVAFLDKEDPTAGLAGVLRARFLTDLAERYAGGQIEVEIIAVRPNGKLAHFSDKLKIHLMTK